MPAAEIASILLSQDESSRQFAASSGVEASIPEKTAEALGERVGDAYSDPECLNFNLIGCNFAL